MQISSDRPSLLFLPALLWLSMLILPATAIAVPTLDSDDRIISVDVEPPFFTSAISKVPAGAFSAFDELVTQGGFEPCGGGGMSQPADAGSSASQDSTVSALAYAGIGSTSYTLQAGSCIGAAADVTSTYEVTFTTDAEYEFDFAATLTNADARLENDGGATLFSWTAHSGVVADLQTLPADVYTLRVDVSLVDVASPPTSSSGSGSFDFTLNLIPPAPSVPALGPLGALGLGIAVALSALRSRRAARSFQ